MNTIATNLQSVRARITAACHAAGRNPDQVRLLAVSKTFGADAIVAAHHAGQTAFGENYIQEAVEKITALSHQSLTPALEWHCIGPIQSNKTRLVAEHFAWAQSVDRLKIAERLNDQRPATLPPLQVCIQVNIDGGASKSGAAPADVLSLAQAIAQLPRLRLRGLMCIPDPQPDSATMRAVFGQAHTLFDTLNRQLDQPLDTLSMGMTADLEDAIHAGSTMVRIGTAIFGGRNP